MSCHGSVFPGGLPLPRVSGWLSVMCTVPSHWLVVSRIVGLYLKVLLFVWLSTEKPGRPPALTPGCHSQPTVLTVVAERDDDCPRCWASSQGLQTPISSK
jgi:hypothetical protein